MKGTREGFINKSVSGSTCVGGWDAEANPDFLGKKMSEHFRQSTILCGLCVWTCRLNMYRMKILQPQGD